MVPRLTTICLLAAFGLCMTVALAIKARSEFLSPFPGWMTGAPRWYDALLFSVWYATITIACLAYLRYRARLKRTGIPARPRLWHLRGEVRVVLWMLAAISLLQLPINIGRTAVAAKDASTLSLDGSVLSLFPIEGVLHPLLGLGIVLYDRRRANRGIREQRRLGNRCARCGYDLRATPERCPECGMKVTRDAHPVRAQSGKAFDL